MNIAVAQTSSDSIGINENDVHLSFLPYAHSMEQCLGLGCIQKGVKIMYYGGDILKLMDDVALAKPTVFVGVPRLLNKIYAKIWAGV